MNGERWDLYLVHDRDDNSVQLIPQYEPVQPGEMFFAYAFTDPLMGPMIYPVTPEEWDYFAFGVELITARYLVNAPIEAARFALYLGFPADE